MRPVVVALIAALPAALLPAGTARAQATAASDQQTALTVEQVQRRYRNMAEIHILKCDNNGDGLIERKEMPCVSSIYRVMYLDR